MGRDYKAGKCSKIFTMSLCPFKQDDLLQELKTYNYYLIQWYWLAINGIFARFYLSCIRRRQSSPFCAGRLLGQTCPSTSAPGMYSGTGSSTCLLKSRTLKPAGCSWSACRSWCTWSKPLLPFQTIQTQTCCVTLFCLCRTSSTACLFGNCMHC